MKNLFGLVVTSLFIAGAGWLFYNSQAVLDHVAVRSFTPSQEVASLTATIPFTDEGKFLFYAAHPRIDTQESFNAHCKKQTEEGIVLGCYLSPRNIYIYNVTDSRLEGVKPVTAAHEMLHVAYDRMSDTEKNKINALIEDALPSVQAADAGLAERLKLYEKTEPGERLNELHSIIGTESAVLPKELEVHYKKYFSNRSVVVGYAAQYSKVFGDIKTSQTALVAELDALSNEINQQSDAYNTGLAQLNNDIDQFNARAQTENGFSSQAAFDSAKNELISRKNTLQNTRNAINANVALHNEKRNQLLALNVQVEDLNSKLDSTKLPNL